MTTPKNRWKVVDLFSGCGGMSSGFKSHSDYFEIIGAVDIQKGKPGNGAGSGTSTGCNPTYERNIGVIPKNVDLTILDPADYRRELGLRSGELEVLISCAPCTGFSQKNANNHVVDDPRNKLVERTADFVTEFMPEFLIMENVKELLSGNQRHHFQNLTAKLEGLGYSIYAEVHDLSEYGLPQKRMRALVIAWRDGMPVGPIPSGIVKTVREAIAHLPPVSAGECHPSDPMHVSPKMTQRVLDRAKAIPKNGGSWADVMCDTSLTEEQKQYLLIPSMFRGRPGSFPDVYGRLCWDKPAITITRECAHVGNGRYMHPDQDRLLTVREMALLQGFPESYVFEGPLPAKYNQIGDAVPPLISRLIANQVITMKTGRVTGGMRQLQLLLAVRPR